MSGIATEVAIILLLLILNGVFAMSELAVMTARKIRLEQRAEAGDKGARAALALAHEPTQFLSTVQVGITLIGVLAGAFGGASIAEQLADGFRASATLAPYADALGLTIVVGAITYLSLIIGELVPKRLALSAPERVASLVARPMRVLSRVGSPLVKLLTGSTNLMLRLLGVRAHTDPGVTEEEIRALVEQGAESGVVQPEEHQVVERVFRLGDRQVSALMTPPRTSTGSTSRRASRDSARSWRSAAAPSCWSAGRTSTTSSASCTPRTYSRAASPAPCSAPPPSRRSRARPSSCRRPCPPSGCSRRSAAGVSMSRWCSTSTAGWPAS
jgi:CBS domain containing-hemolysin-like protein